MMRASELRKGNWVNEYGVPIQITPQHILGLHQIEVAGKICIDLEPIPMTEDWLIRLGFEKTDDYGDMIYYELKGSGLRRYGVCNNHDEWQFMLFVKDEYTILIHDEPYFQHVHQLMNLFYALTGEELTLTD